MIKVKRVYEAPAPQDGLRILVDRLWPRGLSKESARIDLWLKDIAPSNELRKWYGHDPGKWTEFRKRYFQELGTVPEAVETILELAQRGPVTLLFSSKELKINNAQALKEYVASRLDAE
ncbi:MAG: DUF488 domain-containing protein [Deltaproteobacteria bacterium]|nr:DUF488 domain-containing protein [Deltaproteobacteria bacterium]